MSDELLAFLRQCLICFGHCRVLYVGDGLPGALRVLLDAGCDAYGLARDEDEARDAASQFAPGRVHRLNEDGAWPEGLSGLSADRFDGLIVALSGAARDRALGELLAQPFRQIAVLGAAHAGANVVNRFEYRLHARTKASWWSQPLPRTAMRRSAFFERLPRTVVQAQETAPPQDMLAHNDSAWPTAFADTVEACAFVRIGDTVLVLDSNAGSAAHVVAQNSAARAVAGFAPGEASLAYARTRYGADPRVSFFADAASRSDEAASLDVLIALDSQAFPADVLRAEIGRVRPGGRVIVGISREQAAARAHEGGLSPRAWLHRACGAEAAGLLAERAFMSAALPDGDAGRTWSETRIDEPADIAGTLILVAMRDPLAGEAAQYVETTFETVDTPAFNVLADHRAMNNPWLFKSMIAIGMRLTNDDALDALNAQVMASAPRGSADFGAALCGHAYRVLGGARPEREVRACLGEIREYVDMAGDSAHQLRWKVSLAFVAARLAQRLGDFAAAEDWALRCAAMDPMPFSPLLGTKVVAALDLAATFALLRGDRQAARERLKQGVGTVRRLLSGDWLNVIGNIEKPLSFGLPEVSQLAEGGARCAYLLNFLDDADARPGFVWQEHRGFFERIIDEKNTRLNALTAGYAVLADNEARLEAVADEREAERLRLESIIAESIAERQRLEGVIGELNADRQRLTSMVGEIGRDRDQLGHAVAEHERERARLVELVRTLGGNPAAPAPGSAGANIVASGTRNRHQLGITLNIWNAIRRVLNGGAGTPAAPSAPSASNVDAPAIPRTPGAPLSIDDIVAPWLARFDLDAQPWRCTERAAAQLGAQAAGAHASSEADARLVIVAASELKALPRDETRRIVALFDDTDDAYALRNEVYDKVDLCIALGPRVYERLALLHPMVARADGAALDAARRFARAGSDGATLAVPPFAADLQGAPVVLLQVDSFMVGGLERVVFDLIDTLAAAGFQPMLGVTGDIAPEAEAELKERRFAYVRLPSEPDALRRLLKEREVALVNAHYSLTLADVCASLGIPFVQTVHNMYQWLDEPNKRKWRHADEITDCYICVSANVAMFADTNLRLATARMLVIPNGCDAAGMVPLAAPERDAGLRAELGLPQDSPVFVNVASINPVKGQGLLIEAFAIAHAARPDIRLVILGKHADAGYAERLREKIAQHGLRDAVLMPGYRPDVHRFVDLARAVVMPSFTEGWSLAISEAVQRHAPVIATDVGGAREQLIDEASTVIDAYRTDWASLDGPQFYEAIAREDTLHAVRDQLAAALVAHADRPLRTARDALQRSFTSMTPAQAYERHVEVFKALLYRKSATPIRYASYRPQRQSRHVSTD
ncbi:group 1 glycosyl transferase [Caballeronia fortuita]|uniref:Group 1 glycosyl transferase n=1 Tax=Caballeronia fortuita TaxID=1777138 RepID=A0A158BNQ0_9BURK|nr:glycosyltransferase [Caballeronia fortuita]SAK71651.1 group 1 glycosyl transferase [Caballeronia fortuita]